MAQDGIAGAIRGSRDQHGSRAGQRRAYILGRSGTVENMGLEALPRQH